MEIRVDQRRCQGHGLCYAAAPDVFEPDELGNAVVSMGLIAASADEVHQAREACPQRAISVQ